MDDTIITIYCMCEEFLEAISHRDDPRVRLSTAGAPHHQRPEETKPGDKAPDEGGEDLPQPRVVLEAGECFGGRAEREEWVTGRRYLNMEELKEWHSKGSIGKEVILTKR